MVTEEGKILHLKAGEAIVEVVDTWHYGKNEGSVPAEIIVFYSGAVGTPITVTEIVPVFGAKLFLYQQHMREAILGRYGAASTAAWLCR